MLFENILFLKFKEQEIYEQLYTRRYSHLWEPSSNSPRYLSPLANVLGKTKVFALGKHGKKCLADSNFNSKNCNLCQAGWFCGQAVQDRTQIVSHPHPATDTFTSPSNHL